MTGRRTAAVRPTAIGRARVRTVQVPNLYEEDVDVDDVVSSIRQPVREMREDQTAESYYRRAVYK